MIIISDGKSTITNDEKRSSHYSWESREASYIHLLDDAEIERLGH